MPINNTSNNKNDRFLCGGVLFFLITEVTDKFKKSKTRNVTDEDTHTFGNVMSGLIYAFTSNEKYPVPTPKDITGFKECKSNGCAGIPFTDTSYINSYKAEVSSNYSEPLKRMQTFVEKHIRNDSNSGKWLVRALLILINKDDSIPDDDKFYVQVSGIPLKKSELNNETNFVLPAFLVGVLHYIVSNRPDRNVEGKDTLNAIGTLQKGSPRKLSLQIMGYENINVVCCPECSYSSDNLEDDQTDDNLKDHISESKAHDQSEQSDQSGQETPTEEVRSSITNIQGNVIINNGYVNSVPVPTPIVVLETKRARALCGSKYFHFIVTNEDGIFEKEWLKMSSSRLISQYTVPAAIQEYCLPLNNETVSNLIELPAIICQENNGSSNLQNQDQKCVLARIERIKIKNIGDVTISFKTILEFNQSLLYDKNAAADLGLEDDPFLTCLRSTQWSIFEGDLSSAFDKLGVVFPDDESSTQLDAQQ